MSFSENRCAIATFGSGLGFSCTSSKCNPPESHMIFTEWAGPKGWCSWFGPWRLVISPALRTPVAYFELQKFWGGRSHGGVCVPCFFFFEAKKTPKLDSFFFFQLLGKTFNQWFASSLMVHPCWSCLCSGWLWCSSTRQCPLWVNSYSLCDMADVKARHRRTHTHMAIPMIAYWFFLLKVHVGRSGPVCCRPVPWLVLDLGVPRLLWWIRGALFRSWTVLWISGWIGACVLCTSCLWTSHHSCLQLSWPCGLIAPSPEESASPRRVFAWVSQPPLRPSLPWLRR